MSDLLNFLRSHTAEALVDPSTIYACDESDTLDKAFQLMKDQHILSVPVKNADGKYTRFIDILDLAECVAEVCLHCAFTELIGSSKGHSGWSGECIR